MASLGYNDLTHSGPAHENTYHVCDKQALTNKDIYVYEMWAFFRYLLFSYCPLLRQNIDFFLGGGGGGGGGGRSVFHDNDNWEWLYMSEVAVF